MIEFLKQVPRPQRVLGLAGLLPFWLPVLLSFDPGISIASLLMAQKLYAAVILSFLGGVHWGVTVADSRLSTWARVGWSVTPALIGWIGALLSGALAITVLALGFAIAAGVDLVILSGQALWYRRLRIVLSGGAIGALLVSLFGMQPYTTDAAPALLGLGASAIGSLPQGYVQNAPSVPAYRAAIQAGHLPTARGIAVTDTDRMRREVIERLMCDLAVDLDAVALRYRQSRAVFGDALRALEEMVRDGIVALEGGKVTVDPQWRPAVRLVCAAFDEYLPQNAVRHSVAV